MIDHLIRFNSEAEAQADAVCGKYYADGSWDMCRTNPSVRVWRPADDVTEAATGPGGEPLLVPVHVYLPYFYLMIGLPEINEVLRGHPTCMLVTDRRKAREGESFVLYSPLSPDNLASYRFTPCFAGSSYPFDSPI